MAFPTLNGTAVATTGAATSPFTANLPSGIVAGELLLLFVYRLGGAQTFTISGWTAVTDSAYLNSTVQMQVWYKIADGTEGSTESISSDVTTSQSRHCWCSRISGHDPTTPVIAGAAVGTSSGTTSSVNPPNFAPGLGTKDFLWFTYANATSSNLNSTPSGWTTATYRVNTAPRLGIAFLASTLASADPGIFATGAVGGNASAAKTAAVVPMNVAEGVGAASGSGTLTATGTLLYSMNPSADVSDGRWTDDLGGTSLAAAIDEEEALDTDYIRSADNPSADVCRVALSNPAGGVGEEFLVEYRYGKEGSGNINLTVRLKEGSTTIASWTHTGVSSTLVTATQQLTAPQVAAITNPNSLELEFEAST